MANEHELVFGDENPIAAEIRKFMGADTYEEIICVTPQFERPEGGTPPWTPKTKEELDSIRSLSDKALEFLCCKQWDKGHWLYPGEWYNSIPDGYEIVSISDDTKKFKRGSTDDDIRLGCLPYGFKR